MTETTIKASRTRTATFKSSSDDARIALFGALAMTVVYALSGHQLRSPVLAT